MAYIGQGIKQGTFKELDTSGNTYNGSNTTFNLGTQVGSAAQLLVSHDGVIQKAGTDYTLATGGTQITFSTAPASGASIFITEISGAVGGTVTPSDTSVTADKLNSALLTGQTDIGANIADADLFLIDDGAGGTLRKTAASRLKTYAGFSVSDITGATELAATPADTDELIISDAGTLKRIDFSHIKGELNAPAFKAVLSGTQSISNVTGTVMALATEQLDTGGCYNTSNYRFTPDVEGYYLFVVSGLLYYGNAAGEYGDIAVHKNGTKVIANRNSQSGNMQLSESLRAVGVTHMNGSSDYVDAQIYHQYGTAKDLDSNEDYTYFLGFRITGSV